MPLQDLLKRLENGYNSFHSAYNEFKRATNKASRRKAEEAMSRTQTPTISLIRENTELRTLFLGSSSGQGAAEKFDELRNPKYFDHDISMFLIKVREKIEEEESGGEPINQ